MRRRKRREEFTLEMTPLIDCVFLLLAFFLVSTVFKTQELALLLQLPKSEAAEARLDQESLTIELDEDALAVNQIKMDIDALGARLDSVQDKTTPVHLRIDEEVPYRRLVQVLDLLQARGLANLAMIARENR